MTRAEAKALQKKYDMCIVRHPITNEAGGTVRLVSDYNVPELDELAGKDISPCAMFIKYPGPWSVWYDLICPKSWFDLWGWVDD